MPREFVERIQNYMVKAGHEAKRHSSWINPDPDYDNAIRAFVGLILDERSGQPFLDDFRAFEREVSHFGLLNSLGQTLLKLAAPGVADTFQGCELWDFSLVDPDNRRPVDYGLRERMLGDLKRAIEKECGARMRLCRELAAQGRRQDQALSPLLCPSRAATTPDFSRPAIIARWKCQAQSRPTCSRSCAGAARPKPSWRHPASGPDCLRINRTQAELNGARSWHPARWLAQTWSTASNHNRRISRAPGHWESTGRTPASCSSAGERFSGWCNVFTGEVHTAAGDEAALSLPCADLFAHFPVALLLNDPASPKAT